MFEQILTPVFRLHLEIVRPRPLGQAFNLIPAVHDVLNFNDSALPDKAPWHLVRFAAGIAFDLDGEESHATNRAGVASPRPSARERFPWATLRVIAAADRALFRHNLRAGDNQDH